jgi:hypothetical protein
MDMMDSNIEKKYEIEEKYQARPYATEFIFGEQIAAIFK